MLICLITVPAAAVYGKQILLTVNSLLPPKMRCALGKVSVTDGARIFIFLIPKAQIFQSIQDNVLQFGGEWLNIIHQTEFKIFKW